MIQLRRRLYNSLPLIVAIFVTFGYVFLLEKSILTRTGGVIMYPLDDTFIHMQVAKNLAFEHTWGIIPGEFSSSSSSILYTLLLAALFKVFSAKAIIPLIVNCIAAVFVLMALDRWLIKQQLTSLTRLIILLAMFVLIPLPILIVSGMEHTLQCLFSFLFLIKFTNWLASNTEDKAHKSKTLPFVVLLLAFLVVAIRYEGIFLIFIAFLILVFYKRLNLALQLSIAGFLPIAIFGFISLSKGSYMLPNSVLVKSTSIPLSIMGIAEFLYNIIVFKLTVVEPRTAMKGVSPPGISLLATQRLLIALPAAYFLLYDYWKKNKAYTYILVILLSCTLLHLSFASTGWFYRYEAYLIFCSLSFLFIIVFKFGKQAFPAKSWLYKAMAFVMLLAIGSPFVLRSMAAFTKSNQACYNIFEQQYQMAKFVQENYNGTAVAANDIGALSFYTSSPVLDLWGLGSIDVARSKKEGKWSAEFLRDFVIRKKGKIAIVYDDWFDRKLLDSWSKVATWEVSNNIILGGETVSFYAIDENEKLLLKDKLRSFQSKLPGDITVAYYE